MNFGLTTIKPIHFKDHLLSVSRLGL